jgi:RNA polymerase sigma-70 factor, ECF subfamily
MPPPVYEQPAELPLFAPLAQTEVREAPADLLRMLYRQVRSLAGPRLDLDDLVQAAAERALRSLPRFEGRSALSTWTYGIAYRTLLDHDRWFRRWRRRFSFADEQPCPEPQNATGSETALLELARARRLYLALEQLPAAKRAVLVLHDLEGLDMREVATVVGANERTVRSRLRDGRRKLALLLSADPLFEKEVPA